MYVQRIFHVKLQHVVSCILIMKTLQSVNGLIVKVLEVKGDVA